MEKKCNKIRNKLSTYIKLNDKYEVKNYVDSLTLSTIN